MKDDKTRLNPFVYISETDIRFYLLVLIGILMPSSEVAPFVIGFLKMGGNEITLFLRFFIVIVMLSFIPFLIYWDYKRFPQKIIKNSKSFDIKRYPDHNKHIEGLHEEYLSIIKKPTLVLQPLETSKSPFTFGTKNHFYICLPGGFIKLFHENINSFKSILLHELGHIFNKDIEKAYLTNSAWRVLFFILSLLLLIYLLVLIIPFLLMKFWGFVYFLLASLAGHDTTLTEDTSFWEGGIYIFGFFLYFLFFLGIIYVLRNQIIRLRELYADAKVLEWEQSSENIIKTLGEIRSEHFSKYELLKKFHPNINERIQVLKNNISLFNPSLWVAFTTGFIYGQFLTNFNGLSDAIFTDWEPGMKYQLSPIIYPLCSILIFPFLMLAISSGFHKLNLKIIFIDKKENFTNAILSIIKYSLIFSLGWQTNAILLLAQPIYISNIEIIKSYILNIKSWILNAFYFSLTLIFLKILGSMLIKRSFSKTEAEKNFFIITIFSSVLYIINRSVTFTQDLPLFEMPPNISLVIIFFLFFSVITFVIIKIKDKNLFCPECRKKIEIADLRLNCPNCHHDLYSWAIYSF